MTNDRILGPHGLRLAVITFVQTPALLHLATTQTGVLHQSP